MSQASTSQSGCGCGGSIKSMGTRAMVRTAATKRSKSCSCGGGCGSSDGCESCRGQDFTRPRFFAGQLLTEDDLDLLMNYVVEKNRLHNRAFFGQGVVCGLMVTCDPCGGGWVRVQPGHALDCCGNDIVVACAQSLDINAMVRRLRLEKNGGVDCGDPCADEKANARVQAATSRTPRSARGVQQATTGQEQPLPEPLPYADYCLYVRYCEQLSDPVAPYATDDPCSVQACEATRVHEGFQFELRCPSCDPPEAADLFTRIRDCLGNLITLNKSARSARSTLLYSNYLQSSLTRMAAKSLFDEARLRELSQAQAKVAALPAKEADWTSAHAFSAAESAQVLASFVAGWRRLSNEEKDVLAKAGDFETGAKSALAALKTLKKETPQAKVSSLVEDALERKIVMTTIHKALLWSQPDEAIKTVPADELELTSAGVMFDLELNDEMTLSMASAKASLIERIESRPYLTDCKLLADAKALSLSTASRLGARHAALATSQGADTLSDILLRYLRECICDAINPPCQPCEDPAVLLACLRVDGCEVVDICNLERTFVLAPATLRYWVPQLRALGDAFERVCCPRDPCAPLKQSEETPPGKLPPTPGAEPAQPPVAAGVASIPFKKQLSLNVAERWTRPPTAFDMRVVAPLLPIALAISSADAERLMSSASALVDIADLRNGVDLRPLLVPFVSGATDPRTRKAGLAAAPSASTHGSTETDALRAELSELREQLAALATLPEQLACLDDRVSKAETKKPRSRQGSSGGGET